MVTVKLVDLEFLVYIFGRNVFCCFYQISFDFLMLTLLKYGRLHRNDKQFWSIQYFINPRSYKIKWYDNKGNFDFVTEKVIF